MKADSAGKGVARLALVEFDGHLPAGYPRQNGLALALREIGRIERTLFMLDWFELPAASPRVKPVG